MKTLLLSSAAFLALATFSEAQALSVVYNNLPANGNYFAPHATFSSPLYEENVAGSIIGTRLSPFGDNTTKYDSVEVGGTAIFGLGLTTPAGSARVATSSASSSFGSGGNSFTFVWGSPDGYNLLSFFSGGNFLGSVNGSGSPSTGAGGYLATVTGMGQFDTIKFETGNTNAFEFAGVSAVPLPASFPMFGAALLALAGFSYSMNRWVAPKNKAVAI